MPMKHLFALIALLLPLPALADDGPAGRYRLSGGPDVVGELVLQSDGHFQYGLIAGALDEHAEGIWRRDGANVRLTTKPTPVPPAFSTGAATKSAEVPFKLLVIWPNGRGVAGVDFTLGFDQGDPVEDYTQDYGWTLPPDEKRIPRWIELSQPMFEVRSPRFLIDAASANDLRFVFTPHDLGVPDFRDALGEISEDTLVLHRQGGEMKFVKTAATD